MWIDLLVRLQGILTIFLGIFIEALPFILLGVIVSAAIQVLIPDRTFQRAARTPLGILLGLVMGLALPVCDCGNVPAARRLMQKGAPVPVGVAYLLAAPIVNPLVIASTWIAFNGDLTMVLGRVGMALAIAVIVALIFTLNPENGRLLTLLPATRHFTFPVTEADHHAEPIPGGRWEQLVAIAQHSAEEFFEMGRFMVVGAFIAATMQTIIPQATLLSLGQGPVASVLVMLSLAVLLSVCSSVDAFVALSFVNTFTPGALLAFLVFGPMVDIKSSLMLLTAFQKRAVALIIFLCAALTFSATVAMNFKLI